MDPIDAITFGLTVVGSSAYVVRAVRDIFFRHELNDKDRKYLSDLEGKINYRLERMEPFNSLKYSENYRRISLARQLLKEVIEEEKPVSIAKIEDIHMLCAEYGIIRKNE